MNRSELLFENSKKLIPGGVNSPVRAFQAVGGNPKFIKRAAGSKIYDEDGSEYIDYVGSWGPMILGHNHPRVNQAIIDTVQNGISFGAPTSLELEMAEIVTRMVPSIEMVRMVNSGTEATMSAIRLARGYSGKNKIIKFDGCYHGHSDSLLVQAGSGVETLGLPDSPGVPKELANLTISLPFNDLEPVEKLLQRDDDIALIILEPVIGNMGLILPHNNFLNGLRSLADKYNVILIFDEVMTGFRISSGGAQKYFNVEPDLTTLGKIIGGGLPVGAYGGKRTIMEQIAPSGSIYQAGTLSGSPIAMAAGLATLTELEDNNQLYDQLELTTKELINGLEAIFANQNITVSGSSISSMFGLYFIDKPLKIKNYTDAKRANVKLFSQFHQEMLKNGIYLAPSQFESGFVSTAHTQEDIEKTLDAAAKSVEKLTLK